MPAFRETPLAVLRIALLVSLVCSMVVAGSAVGLKSMQLENRRVDRERHLLAIVGLHDRALSATEVAERFRERITPHLVDLDTGAYVASPPGHDRFDPLTWEGSRAATDPVLSRALSRSEDIAGIQRRERYAVVYKLMTGERVDALILPVRGYGLWSTLYGFLAVDADLDTVLGLRFYQHAETPGLGGEVDNPRWKALWPGKRLFDTDGQLRLRVGKASGDSEDSRWRVDALAGATLTSNGVNNMIRFWLGPQGYGPYLRRLRQEGFES
ncbi:Na(+)-translocating NADH-quinone reductase subunit C [Accumulibacter sp.]|jgi:Na+-transporting NADH:ubiquinone oxidoreductase subunit C|uniref:Na(+)-translocating NADH-quinone reductase subunit C n=1 Tax=Accumulibacter regalis TaxID=522306 RepID=C7RRF1_ACCRE|nr:Na(+)-translocating NADH-quinone reductase subunit C [Accumulibacter sp.]MBN8498825.1 Na(+)-translocating NADH-quinone reductase subunit C [Accumulibacter sp.]MBO3717572.1 Na(+)-translocating NADH-quinone reductase subunit C [Accumulibacter sp.]